MAGGFVYILTNRPNDIDNPDWIDHYPTITG